MKDTVLMEEMSWVEIEDALSTGTRTVVIMTASVEQHGPHLPVITDTAIGEILGEQVARKLGAALLAPVIRPGCSDHHLGFPGSLSIPSDIFVGTVVAYVRSLVRYGFSTFVLLSSHGGNFSALETAGQSLRMEMEPRGVRIIDYSGTKALQEYMQVVLSAAGECGAAQDIDAVHAEATETSVMLVHHPRLVSSERVERGFLGRMSPEEIFSRGLRAITPNGIIGDARLATSRLGEIVIDRLSDHLVAAIQRKLT